MSTATVTACPQASITDAERARRRSALDNAIGNLRGEGMYLSAEDMRLQERYVQGEVANEDILAELNRRYPKR